MTILEEIKSKIEKDIISGEDLPAVLDAITEIANTDEDALELLSDMAEEEENVWVNFNVPGLGEHCLAFFDGHALHLKSTRRTRQ